ncbi:MAG TPA: molybdopterin-synthase adenylyltransferase MoeB [Oligoflexia bacterium]|nr:molybdopterin-synthase adenylyltransferase MoeB [Oligoflexia bacterium]HMP49129.1 molybdopterin-synthase adenylyltransferase MoeB [Oligoflexia bacterium]
MPIKQELSKDEIDAKIANEIFSNKSDCFLIDVREKHEFDAENIRGSIHAARGQLPDQLKEAISKKDSILLIYCASGIRSLSAANTLRVDGYNNVFSIKGGIVACKLENFPTNQSNLLNENEKSRYSRHLLIPEVGEKGQQKLLNSKVLVVGVGGLGSPVAYYLSAAGVGTLGLVDFDYVEESNLQRQIIHSNKYIGKSKIESAVDTLKNFNPQTNLMKFEEKLSSNNIERIFSDFDIIIDGSDNFGTRYLVNDACISLKKPCLHGSLFRFEGQVSFFHPSFKGPCYRCLYPEAPPKHLVPSCAQAGVLGVVPGVVGLIQATEAIKHIIGIGTSLIGRLLCYDAMAMQFSEFEIKQNPNCKCCGSDATFIKLEDLGNFCDN